MQQGVVPLVQNEEVAVADIKSRQAEMLETMKKLVNQVKQLEAGVRRYRPSRLVELQHKFIIADQITADAIFGIDFLEANMCILNLAKEELSVNQKNNHTFISCCSSYGRVC